MRAVLSYGWVPFHIEARARSRGRWLRGVCHL